MGALNSRTEGILSGKNSPPSRLFSIYSKLINPEDEMSENDENWEEDTNDTEIMKNINSLLDSGKKSFN